VGQPFLDILESRIDKQYQVVSNFVFYWLNPDKIFTLLDRAGSGRMVYSRETLIGAFGFHLAADMCIQRIKKENLYMIEMVFVSTAIARDPGYIVNVNTRKNRMLINCTGQLSTDESLITFVTEVANVYRINPGIDTICSNWTNTPTQDFIYSIREFQLTGAIIAPHTMGRVFRVMINPTPSSCEKHRDKLIAQNMALLQEGVPIPLQCKSIADANALLDSINSSSSPPEHFLRAI